LSGTRGSVTRCRRSRATSGAFSQESDFLTVTFSGYSWCASGGDWARIYLENCARLPRSRLTGKAELRQGDGVCVLPQPSETEGRGARSVKVTTYNQRRSAPFFRALVVLQQPCLFGRRSRQPHLISRCFSGIGSRGTTGFRIAKEAGRIRRSSQSSFGLATFPWSHGPIAPSSRK
jgi:hypothetical protein